MVIKYALVQIGALSLFREALYSLETSLEAEDVCCNMFWNFFVLPEFFNYW